MIGFVDYWNTPRGWAFIKTNSADSGQKYFAHVTAFVSGKPITGALVNFESGRTSKGLVAINISVVAPEAAIQILAAMGGAQ